MERPKPKPTSKRPKAPPAQKARDVEGWIDMQVAYVRAMEKWTEGYQPSRRDFFAAAALTGILACPKIVQTAAGSSASDNAIAYADALIAKLDKTANARKK